MPEDQAPVMAPRAQRNQDFTNGSHMGKLRPMDSLQLEEGAQV